MPWNPDQYHKFGASFNDLLQLVRTRTSLRVVDLGGGTGKLTHKPAETLPKSNVLGLALPRQPVSHPFNRTFISTFRHE